VAADANKVKGERPMKKQLKQKLTRCLSLLITLLTVCNLSVSAFAASPALAEGAYVFYTINKVMNLNILYKAGVGAEVGTDYASGETNEIILVNHVKNTKYVTLRPTHHSNLYLSGEKGKGNGLTLGSGSSSNHYYQWEPISVGNGQTVFKNRATNLVMDCTNGWIGEEDIGNRYISWDRNNYAAAQSFYCVRISEKTNKLTPSNRVYPSKFTCSFVASSNQSMAINAQYTKGAGTSVVLDNLSNPPEKNEVVTVTPVKDGLYSLSFQHSPNTCIVASDIFTDSKIVLKNFNKNDPNCLWEVYKVGSSGYSFRNAGNFLMLDNYCHGSSVGNAQISYSYTGGDPQIYYSKTVSSASSSGSSNSVESAVLARLNEMMSGSYNGQFKLNTKYRGQYASEQCKGFSKDVYLKLFGYNIGSTCSKPNNYKINISSSQTKLVGSLTSLSSRSNSQVRNLFDQAQAGDFIQLRRSHGGSHSAIFVSSDSNGVTFYEANLDGNNTIVKKTYTWSQFRSSNQAVSVYAPKNYKLK